MRSYPTIDSRTIGKYAYVLILAWVTTVIALALSETKPAVQLFVFGLVVVLGGLLWLFPNKGWKRYPIVTLILFMFLAASLATFIQFGLWLFPPVSPDGQSVMPIGQTFIGGALGIAFFIVASWLYFARLRPDPKGEMMWVFITSLIFGIVLVVDYFF